MEPQSAHVAFRCRSLWSLPVSLKAGRLFGSSVVFSQKCITSVKSLENIRQTQTERYFANWLILIQSTKVMEDLEITWSYHRAEETKETARLRAGEVLVRSQERERTLWGRETWWNVKYNFMAEWIELYPCSFLKFGHWFWWLYCGYRSYWHQEKLDKRYM